MNLLELNIYILICIRSSSADGFNPPLPPSDCHMTGHVSDLVALNLEVNTSALNINDRVTPEEGINSATTADNTHDLRPRDFLDLLDTTPSAGNHHALLQQPHTSSPVMSSPLCWSNTPSRPRLFPHKLY